MFKKVIDWIKSVFTKDNVKRFIHEAELSVVACGVFDIRYHP